MISRSIDCRIIEYRCIGYARVSCWWVFRRLVVCRLVDVPPFFKENFLYPWSKSWFFDKISCEENKKNFNLFAWKTALVLTQLVDQVNVPRFSFLNLGLCLSSIATCLSTNRESFFLSNKKMLISINWQVLTQLSWFKMIASATAKLNIYTNLWLILKKDKSFVTVTSIIIIQGFGTTTFKIISHRKCENARDSFKKAMLNHG